MSAPAAIPREVFSEAFQNHPSFEAVLAQANQSPHLVGLLTQLHARGDRVELETANPRSAYFSSGDGDIHIGRDLLPAVDPVTGAPQDPSYNQAFVSMLGHEGGHAVVQDRSLRPSNPLEAQANGLNGEGVALTSEYIVAEQIGGRMWSGGAIQAQLDATAVAQGVDTQVASRSPSDPAENWRAFDNAAQQQGAAYYAGLNPSTSPNTTYSEYYPEAWAVQRAGIGFNEIDWANVQSNQIEIAYNADNSYTLTGTGVPFDEGRYAGQTLDFQGNFTSNGRPSGTVSFTPQQPSVGFPHEAEHATNAPATAGLPAATDAPEPAISADQRRQIEQAERLLGPGVLERLNPAQRETVCAAAAAHCLGNQRMGPAVQGFLSPDGQTIAFRHEPMAISELSVAQALEKTSAEHLQGMASQQALNASMGQQEPQREAIAFSR